jgi:hypothetical protein
MFTDPELLQLFEEGDRTVSHETEHGLPHHVKATAKSESAVIKVSILRPGMFTPLDALIVRVGAGNHDTGMKYGKPNHAPLGARDTALRLRARGFPEDIIDEVCFIIGHHRTDDYLRVRKEIVDPARLRRLAAVVFGDKSVESVERVREDARKRLVQVFGRKPADFPGSQYAWLSQWQWRLDARTLNFLVEGDPQNWVSSCDVAGVGSLIGDDLHNPYPRLQFSDANRRDGLLLCKLVHLLDRDIVTPAEFMGLFGYRFVGLHYAALDLGCAFVARFKTVKAGEEEQVVSYTYNESTGGWDVMHERESAQESAA